VASVISLHVVELASTGPAFQASASLVRGSRVARRELGVVTGFGVAVSGDVIEEGSSGSAHISFDVLGSWRSGRAHMTVIKQNGHWWVTGASLDVDGETYLLPTQTPP
jgi:hypothetical protein